MGCDIHLRVEYLAPSETLNERLEVIPEGPSEWTPAERLVPKDESLEAKRWYFNEDGLPTEEWADVPDLYLAYEDRWYSSRDYALFGALAGVRDYDELEIWEERGFPDDASDHVREDFEGWGGDAHTPSWQNLDELLSVDWNKRVFARRGGLSGGWTEMLERLKDLAFARCEGDQTRVRIVYWFDN